MSVLRELGYGSLGYRVRRQAGNQLGLERGSGGACGDQACEHIGRSDAGRQQIRALRLHSYAGTDKCPDIAPGGFQAA